MTKYTVVCLGELLIDFVPDTNGQALSDVSGFRRAAGGAPGNVAAAVARLGGTSRFIGKVGEDPFGDYLQQTLAEAGVDVSTTLLRTSVAKTGLAFVSLRADGERDFMFYRSPAADVLLCADEVDDRALADAAVFHYGSVSLIEDPCRTATEEVAQRARRMGAIVSYDPNVRLPLWSSAAAAREAIMARMHLADLVKVSEEEIVFLTGTKDIASGARQLLAAGPQVIVVTMGARGSRVITQQMDYAVPGFAVQAIDATGAGDGFVGALLYQLTQHGVNAAMLAATVADIPFIERTLRWANAVGALATTKRGAIPALPTRSEVDALLANGRFV
jgi:fructokinase